MAVASAPTNPLKGPEAVSATGPVAAFAVQESDCCFANGTPGCDDPACEAIVCAVDPFCCDVQWDGICAGEAAELCFPLCEPELCDLDCPPGALEEGEACGTDTNGGCNSAPIVFTDAQCGDTFCGTAWADGGTRDTDWYLVNHAGGVISSTLVSQSQCVNFIVDVGGGNCSVISVVGNIGCANECLPIADASADLPPGAYVVFVATGTCDGGGIFEGVPCGSGFNDYYISIACEGVEIGACCLPDGTCVDGTTQPECETPPDPNDCGDCNLPDPDGLPGCSDPECEAIVCAVDPFCCDVAWDSICAGEAEDLCECGGVGGLGGEWAGPDTFCADDPCEPTGACCQCDDEGVQFCTVEAPEDCLALGGEYLGDGEPCFLGGDEEITLESSPNVPIPDGSGEYVSDTISMGMDVTIDDIRVDVAINHTWLGDVCVKLAHGADEWVLIQRMNFDGGCAGADCCGCSANNMDVTLWDGAAAGIEDQCADGLSGTYYSESFNLSNFVGGSSLGDWTLSVNDNAGADTGTFVAWGITFVTAGEQEPVCPPCNEAPDCSGAYASLDELWPANHKFQAVTIEGVTDADGDPITITITGIWQDEPVDAEGDGHTCPDGMGVGTDTAMLRAERSGLGDGRVYHIMFVAEDGQGGSCEGAVTVCVPRDQSGDVCVDEGPLYDSTDCDGFVGIAPANVNPSSGGTPGWGSPGQ
jgi:subtilisin-like proprotein convertase family protein